MLVQRLGQAAAALAMGAALLGAKAPAVSVGELAPDAEILLVDGSKIRLSAFRGEVVLLNFWATWCVPCRTELPILNGFYKARRENGLRVFAVTTEGSLPVSQLQGLFKVMAIPAARRIGGPYAKVRAVPTNYIIDRAGRVRFAKAASLTLDDLNREVIPLLNEPAPDSGAPE